MRRSAALALVSVLCSCATVTRGTRQTFEITSQPPGADVGLTSGVTCVTPCTLKLKRKTGFVATISKAGYVSAHVTVVSKMHGGGTAGLVGNALGGGVIGIMVDAGNGSLNDLTPNPIMVDLAPEAATGPVAIGPVARAALIDAGPRDAAAPRVP